MYITRLVAPVFLTLKLPDKILVDFCDINSNCILLSLYFTLGYKLTLFFSVYLVDECLKAS